MLDASGQITRIRREGDSLASAVERGRLDSLVPWCPGWDLEALLRHVGDVHRWAAAIVRERLRERPRREVGTSSRTDLIAWYRQGVVSLVDALESTSPDDEFWHWGPAPSALAFWARRQANETAIHRCDAESAHGPITPLPTAEALDGIDEWLRLAVLRCSAPAGGGRILLIKATDGEGQWAVTLDEALQVGTDRVDADCAVSAPASELFLWTLNRRSNDGLDVAGDASLLTIWSRNVKF